MDVRINPRLQIRRERALPIVSVINPQPRGMQCVTRQKQALPQFVSPPRFDEAEIKLFVGAIDFIPDDWMPEVRKMHADLVGATRARERADKGKPSSWSNSPNESLLHAKFGQCWCAFLVDRLLEPDGRGPVRALSRE